MLFARRAFGPPCERCRLRLDKVAAPTTYVWPHVPRERGPRTLCQGDLTRAKRQATLTSMAQDAGSPRKVLYRVMFGRRDPLKVLADIRTLRAYLDEREVEVVKTAREGNSRGQR